MGRALAWDCASGSGQAARGLVQHFDRVIATDAFTHEVRRVLKPQGVLALWGYGRWRVEHPRLNAVLQEFYDHVIGPFWPPERQLVERGYRSLRFPFTEIAAPAMHLTAQWDLHQLVQYMTTWSAVNRYLTEKRVDPLLALQRQCAQLALDPSEIYVVQWPLSQRWFRVD